MKKISLLLFLILTNLYCYEDLGIYGLTYDIKEKSLIDEIEQRYEKNKNEIEKNIKKKYLSSFITRSPIPNCKKSEQRYYTPIKVLSKDVIMPISNKVIHKKGEFNILKENSIFFNKRLLFINADDPIQIALAKELKYGADIYVVNGDIHKLLVQGINANLVKSIFELQNFNLQCTPSIYTQQDYQFVINQYNPKDLGTNK